MVSEDSGRHTSKPPRLRGLTKEDDGTLPVRLSARFVHVARRRLPLLVTSHHYKEYLSLSSLRMGEEVNPPIRIIMRSTKCIWELFGKLVCPEDANALDPQMGRPD